MGVESRNATTKVRGDRRPTLRRRWRWTIPHPAGFAGHLPQQSWGGTDARPPDAIVAAGIEGDQVAVAHPLEACDRQNPRLRSALNSIEARMTDEPWRPTPDGIVVACRLTPKGGREAIEGVERLSDGTSVLIARVRARPRTAGPTKRSAPSSPRSSAPPSLGFELHRRKKQAEADRGDRRPERCHRAIESAVNRPFRLAHENQARAGGGGAGDPSYIAQLALRSCNRLARPY